MPRRTDLHSILIIGSGPIVIGQACEFDYSGTQACKALRQDGFRVILVNSNPATIMTDPELADATYIEPLTAEVLEQIIAKERPDALLPTMGGQTGLNLAVELAERGVLDRYGVELIGSNLRAIRLAEDRMEFLRVVESCGLEMPRGAFVTSVDEGMAAIERIGFPAIIRPSFTLGGTGGGIAYNIEEFPEVLRNGLLASPIHRVLVEESVLGWKEYELEVMRDRADNVVIICSIENFDPMGVHTGDSITVAPAQTLSDREYQRMRDAAIKIIRAVGVDTGGSNIQFAVNPRDGRMVVIEMNPRVSRSSALASKATGFPIAKIAAKLAVGYTLDEIQNDITRRTPSSFEPALDYVVVKIPRWDFEKFPEVEDRLGVQMKSVGEVMAIGRTFKEALQKAIRSLEKRRYGFGFDTAARCETVASDESSMQLLRSKLSRRSSTSLDDLCDALRAGISVEEIHALTGYDPWFIDQCKQIVDEAEQWMKSVNTAPAASLEERTSPSALRRMKQLGFSDVQLAAMSNTTETEVRLLRAKWNIQPVFKTIDTCAAEFESETPYHYSTYGGDENEARRTDRKKVVILGSGPNRIGQGIEFDYCCVRAVWAAHKLGWEAIMINCNPETVSTDYDTADKLYFEPLTFEDVMNILELERPDGVIVTLGGQTPLKLAGALVNAGVKLLGTPWEGIDLAEDRRRFGKLLDDLGIPCPQYGTAQSEEEAVAVAERIGYPVLVRPSYVLGGRAMHICYREEMVRRYAREALENSPDHPVLIDHFLEHAYEFDVDCIADGEDVLICGIMQHIEEAGVHSGDSSCVIPPYNLDAKVEARMIDYTSRLARALGVRGLLNVQYALQGDVLYVLEANPRASRTVPFVAKATGVPVVEIATHVMLGKSLRELGYTSSILRPWGVAIKEPVFPFTKFPRVNVFPGPEMRSTGEVMGCDTTFGGALLKAHQATGIRVPTSGTVFLSLRPEDKNERALVIARGYKQLGFRIIATGGTAAFLREHGIDAETVLKHYEGRPSIIDFIKNGQVQMLINTPLGERARYDEFIMGMTAMQYKIPFFTTLAAAEASLEAIAALRQGCLSVHSLQEVFSGKANGNIGLRPAVA
ncbi:MAG: carbamoyl-phosphate synthase large subunit [Bacteroidota bacterium]|nr:carbamoyl-phosphate synthase large subunit [Candidatus Kapabacteria bacterium]MCS7302017.1 carbamoyl-phosphate synthase large subunit [Candidatus Kapabacteria bacterium]MCX7936817.1 carbamoyl-phosphate synthase large subunit [Chlorobiota bacterium]MDW8074536.1 carbamoyl-phosphate synthase large subunit [Bacteroidota bacterium]MDW8270988.1 carbamoyl-phosphate synthase large subunit [Bacteroidota bacterium]